MNMKLPGGGTVNTKTGVAHQGGRVLIYALLLAAVVPIAANGPIGNGNDNTRGPIIGGPRR